MKVLFLTSRHCFTYPVEPLGQMYLSAVLKKAGHEVVNLELEAIEDLETTIKKEAPGLIAYSATTGLHRVYLDATQAIKRFAPDIPTILGGPHPSFLPEVLETSELDIICKGEGEMAMLELADALQAGKDYSKILNLHVKKRNGEIVKNESRPYLTKEEMDALPFPDRDMMRSHPQIWRNGLNAVMTGRGCPYKCSYCFNETAQSAQSGRFVRKHGVERAIAEIKDFVAYCGTKSIIFEDDILVMNKRWFREFAPAYKKEVGLPYICHSIVDIIDEEVAELLAESGCSAVAFGLENGNEKFRAAMLHKFTTNEQIIRASRALKANGIEVISQNILGFPEETPDITLETAALNVAAGVDTANFYFFTPYPGTWAGDYAKQKGYLNLSYESFPVNFHEQPPVESPHKEDFQELVHLVYLGMDYPALLPFMNFVYTRMRRENPLRRIAVKGLFFLSGNIRKWPYFRNRPTILPQGLQNIG
ncbi:MAG: B12-binding domain-containing radical SAM protein [Candidatus Omnitrophica bacterium]|nr:hypothetical protein [bacterium]NUN97253.1 B12-binding domain-containing radical SAM protein [Candidatus Omnitrophota bacterium]